MQNSTTERVLRFIKGYKRRTGISPSFRDIMIGCGISSTSVVAYHVTKLREQGEIDYTRETRSIRVKGEKLIIPEMA